MPRIWGMVYEVSYFTINDRKAEGIEMKKRLTMMVTVLAAMLMISACNANTDSNNNANNNANTQTENNANNNAD